MASMLEGLRELFGQGAPHCANPLYRRQRTAAALGDSPASRAYPADVETVGSGHFCQLEVPGQINAMIRRFLAVALPANVHDLG
jgi:hypothetical protein